MPRILLVKTSSLGDVVHNLPVASDIAAALPSAEIDWVVEKDFAAIPRLHRSLSRVLPVSLRRWRSEWWRADTRGEIAAFIRGCAIRPTTRCSIRKVCSRALSSRGLRGERITGSTGNHPASRSRFSTTALFASPGRVTLSSAIARSRRKHCGTSRTQTSTMGSVRRRPLRSPWLDAARYAILIHVTSARPKLWPDEHWVAVGDALSEAGVISVLPWGSAHEHERSVRLSRSIRGSIVPPALNLSDLAACLERAHCALGVDTGLTHLAGALGVATLGIYTATDPQSTGLYGCARAINIGGAGQCPTAVQALRSLESVTR